MNQKISNIRIIFVFLPSLLGLITVLLISHHEKIERRPASPSEVGVTHPLNCLELGRLFVMGPLDSVSFFNYYRLLKENLEASGNFGVKLNFREEQAKRFVKKLQNHKITQISFEEELREVLATPLINFPLLKFWKKGQYQINAEVMNQIFSRGIKNFLEQSGYELKRPNPLRSFLDSTSGEVVRNIFFNSGIFWGYPPIYFKGFKTQMIPDHLLLRALEEGPHDEILKEIKNSLSRSIGPLTLDFNRVVTLEKLRRQVLFASQTIFAIMVLKDTYFDIKEIETFEEVIEDLGKSLEEEAQRISDLQDAGFDLFGDGDDLVFESFYCKALKFCLDAANSPQDCEEYRELCEGNR